MSELKNKLGLRSDPLYTDALKEIETLQKKLDEAEKITAQLEKERELTPEILNSRYSRIIDKLENPSEEMVEAGRKITDDQFYFITDMYAAMNAVLLKEIEDV